MASRAPQRQNQANVGSGSKPVLQKPKFVKIDSLKPGTYGHNITVKVISVTAVPPKKPLTGRSSGQQPRISECLVGDDTGTILFTARNDQVNMMKIGANLIIRNAKIDMFKGSMRLAVDKWGRIEAIQYAHFTVKEDNNLSLVEYELVNVVEE